MLTKLFFSKSVIKINGACLFRTFTQKHNDIGTGSVIINSDTVPFFSLASSSASGGNVIVQFHAHLDRLSVSTNFALAQSIFTYLSRG